MLDTTIDGRASGLSNEEAAFQQLTATLLGKPGEPSMKKPSMYCGWRAYATWMEILCGTSLVTRGISSDGRGKDEFKMAAEASGRVAFVLSKETINTRSGMAWQVDEVPVLIVRDPALPPDEVVLIDRGVQKQ